MSRVKGVPRPRDTIVRSRNGVVLSLTRFSSVNGIRYWPIWTFVHDVGPQFTKASVTPGLCSGASTGFVASVHVCAPVVASTLQLRDDVFAAGLSFAVGARSMDSDHCQSRKNSPA